MAGTHAFRLRATLNAATLESWVAEGWIIRRETEAFTEVDLARAGLIQDLREELGLNDAGVAVVLDLLDQVHGLRGALRQLSAAIGDLPEPARQMALEALRRASHE